MYTTTQKCGQVIPVGGRVDRRQLQNTARLLRSVVEEGCGEVKLATQNCLD